MTQRKIADFLDWTVDEHPYLSILIMGPAAFAVLCFIFWVPIKLANMLP